jgi:putative ABC transport system ATP-binding protein
MLTIADLNFSFDKAHNSLLFNSLDLRVEKAEHIVLVGDSGTGKSTLLNIIADAEQAAIKLDAGKRSTMVLQEGALFDHLNVIDNLRLVARYANGAVNEAHIVATLERLGIQKKLHQANVNQLSGGQMRRVAIARALLSNPDLILFDEPDAGLDIVNLQRLGKTVNALSTKQGKTCITISHNPFYIAQVATKVYRLQRGKLVLIADWPNSAGDEAELHERQFSLQGILSEAVDEKDTSGASKRVSDWALKQLIIGVLPSIFSIFHLPKSPRDELRIAAYVSYLSLITGLVFFALVGLMLGSTLIAVVRLLADNAISGLVSWFIQPETLIEMMGGRYVVYLAPAIGGMLFAARSGSIMTNWLGEMVRGKQVRALTLLGIDAAHYLTFPSLFALFASMFLTLVWFTFSVWLGGVWATEYLFQMEDVVTAMTISEFDMIRSSFWMKTAIYSALVSLVVITLGMAKKTSAHQVNIHTTKAIIYSTLSIAFAEMALILL